MAGAVKNLWFWVSFCLLAANTTVASLWWKHTHGRPPTSVLGVFPQDLSGVQEPVTVTFSRPMIPPRREGTELTRTIPEVQLSPKVALDAIWRSPTTLELRPRRALARATPYQLKISRRLLDSEGFPLAADSLYELRTRPVTTESVRQASLSQDWKLAIDVTFSDEVPLAGILRFLHVVDDTETRVPITLQTRGETAKVLRLETDAKRRKWIRVTVEAGIRGIAGPLSLEAPVSYRLPIESVLRLRNATARIKDLHDAWIDLYFPLPVDGRIAADFIRVEPEARYAVKGHRNRLRLRGNFAPETTYRVFLRKGLPGKGGRVLPEDAVRTVRIPELSPRLGFLGDGRFLTEGGRNEVLLGTVNVDRVIVTAQRVFPNNLVHHLNGSSHVGAAVFENKQITVNGVRNRPSVTRVDLKEIVGPGWRGPVVLEARSKATSWQRTSRTLTVTDLGIHAKVHRDGLLVWIIRLSELTPVAGARVTVLSRTNQELFAGASDAQGLLHFHGRSAVESGEPYVVTAVTEDDFSYLPLDEGLVGRADIDAGGRAYPQTSVEAFVYAERGVLRPGESIHVRAILRQPDGALPQAGMPLTWEVMRPDKRTAASFAGSTSRYGTSEIEWKSEPYHPTGLYIARVRVPGSDGPVLGTTTFRVEEFLPETLRVELFAEARRFAGGSPLAVKVKAEHLFGAAAQGLLAKARCDLRPLAFTHGAWPGVQFSSSDGELTELTIEAPPAPLDGNGEAKFLFELPEELRAASALQAVVTATVFEVSGRASTARIVRQVDPLPFYLGTRQPGGHARVGESWKIEVIAVKPDGSPMEVASLEGRLYRVSWSHTLKKDPNSRAYRWTSRRDEDPVTREEVSCVGGAGAFRFTPELGGEYRLQLVASRGAERNPIETSVTFFVEGGESDGGSLEIPQRITLTADRPYYRVGDTARVRVQSPIAGIALLATETARIHDARTFTLGETETTLEVPVTADLHPHGYVTLTVVRSSLDPAARGVPVRAYGALALRLDTTELTADIELDLPTEVRPGSELPLELRVTRRDGTPERGELAVALVDAGILALTAFDTPDPVSFFSAQRALGTRAADVYSLIVPEPDVLLASASALAGGGGEHAALLSPIVSGRVRSVVLWLGGLEPDEQGRISTTIRAPDFDGELVAVAVLSGEATLGSAKRTIKVRRPVILEPALPRFLAPGDRWESAVTVHNTTDQEVHATVDVTVTGGIRLAADATRQESTREVYVAAEGSSVLRYALEAVSAGPARITFTCRAFEEKFSKSVNIPVRPAAPPISEYENLVIDTGPSMTVAPKGPFLEGTVRSELVLSSNIFPTLEGSLRYLLRYPYGCLEQTTSKLIPWITLRDYLEAIGSEAYTEAEIRDNVEAGISRIFGMQTAGGGFALWPRSGARPYPYGTLHATTILLEARSAGYALPEKAFERLLDYLDGLVSDPGSTNPQTAATVRAHALSLLARSGRVRNGWIENLYERRNELGDEGRAHLAIAAATARKAGPEPEFDLDSVLEKKREAPHRDLDGLLYSRARELCYVLGARVDLGTPRQQLLPLLETLTGMREGGRFRSTHEDGLFVFALGKLAKVFPPSTGPARVELKLPDGDTRELEVSGRQAIALPAGEQSLEITLLDGGPLYAFSESRGVPTGDVAEEDHGLSVRRSFLLPDGEPRAEGPFQQGEAVLVEVRLKTPRALRNVVVVDALPAGFEVENPHLVTADGKVVADRKFRLVRSDLRDDRLLLFANPQAGESTYRYVARAVTPGRFALPPIAAECMYDTALRSTHGAGEIEVRERN